MAYIMISMDALNIYIYMNLHKFGVRVQLYVHWITNIYRKIYMYIYNQNRIISHSEFVSGRIFVLGIARDEFWLKINSRRSISSLKNGCQSNGCCD